MNVDEFTFLLQHPSEVKTPVQTKQLEEVLKEYPYFQAAHALHLKGLKNLNSFKYNNALKVTAAHTSDRDVLFDFITSPEFLADTIADTITGKAETIKEHEVIAEEVLADPGKEPQMIADSDDNPLPQSVKDADTILDPSLFKSKDPHIDKTITEQRVKAEKELALGSPLDFTQEERYSFSEWLQLTSLQKIDRSGVVKEEVEEEPEVSPEPSKQEKNFDRIDKFIETNPKIKPAEEKAEQIDISASLKIDKNELMTETLARVYLEQKKYKNAIQAYKILRLKYPEKSSFFADRISAVKKLQKDNK
jgi:hypothetical protein